MNVESVREYCLSLPLTTEDMAFGEDHLLFRIVNKIFVCMSLDGSECLAMKCEPEYAQELRARYPGIVPAWHWNKKYWNQLSLGCAFDDEFIKALIRHSYSEAVRKLPKKIRDAHPEIVSVCGRPI